MLMLPVKIPKLIDSHTHVQFAAYDADRDAVIQRALENGVWCINVGTQRDTSKKAVELAEQYEGLFATVGLHPIHTEKSYHDAQELGASEDAKGFSSRGEVFDKPYYASLAAHPKTVAIGECGLDYFRLPNDEKSKQTQKDVFEKHITVAVDVRKSLMCHCRPSKNNQDAYDELYEIVKPRIDTLKATVLHFFVGNLDTAKKFLDLGFYFTFGGVITFARNYDEVIAYLPLDRILLETDAPYVTPEPYRGKRNEPAHIVEVAKRMCELKKTDIEALQYKILKNNRTVFGITH